MKNFKPLFWFASAIPGEFRGTLAVLIAIFRPMRIFFILSLCLAGCATGIDWDLISQKDVPSPDGQRVATVFEMSCNCTTGYFPQLTVRRPGEKIGKYGNVLAGGPADTIAVKWTSPTNLLVEYIHLMKKTGSTTVTNCAGVLIEINER